MPEGASPYNALHMAGNVLEYVADNITPSTDAVQHFSQILKPPPALNEPWYSVKGGSFGQPLQSAVPWEWSSVPRGSMRPISVSAARKILRSKLAYHGTIRAEISYVLAGCRSVHNAEIRSSPRTFFARNAGRARLLQRTHPAPAMYSRICLRVRRRCCATSPSSVGSPRSSCWPLHVSARNATSDFMHSRVFTCSLSG